MNDCVSRPIFIIIELAAIHGAETALVEAAPQRGLDDQVVPFGGRAEQRHVVNHIHAEL